MTDTPTSPASPEVESQMRLSFEEEGVWSITWPNRDAMLLLASDGTSSYTLKDESGYYSTACKDFDRYQPWPQELMNGLRAPAAVSASLERRLINVARLELAALIPHPDKPCMEDWPTPNEADARCLQAAYSAIRAAYNAGAKEGTT